MHKVENILLPDHIKIFCFGHQEKQEWWVIKTYHFCKHCNSLSPLGIFCLVYPFFIPYFDVLLLWACVGWCCAHSNTCGVLEQTFKYVSFTKIQNKGLLHVANKWPKVFFVHILGGKYNLGLLSFFLHFNVNHIFMLGEYVRPSKQPSLFWREFPVGTVVFTKL